MTTTTIDRLIPITDVAKRLGIVSEDIRRGLYGVTVVRTWDDRPAVTESEAARLRDELRARTEANRERKREEAARKLQEAEMFENEQERRFWTAYAAVAENGGAYGPSRAAGIALGVVNAKEPENELARVIQEYGQPTERAILFVMGRAKESSITHKTKGKPSWLR